MSLLRRIVQNPTVSRAVPVAKLFVPYPLGRDPSSIPKINPVCNIDRRPISLRYRVTTMIELSNLEEAAKISHLAVSEKFRDDGDTVFICNSVIGAMCGAKRYDEAISLFNYFFNESQTIPNMLSCNLIVKAHCDLGRVDDALELYRHVLLDGVLAPGVETYRLLTKALVDAKRFDEACDLVRSMGRCDFMVYDILIRGFLDSGKFVKASQIFEELKGPNSKLPWREYHKAIAIFNVSFMNYWFKQGKDEEAMEIYAALDKGEAAKNLIVRNKVLEVFVEHGKKTEAWELFREMIETCGSETVDIMLKGFSVTTTPITRVRKTCYRTIIASLCEQGNMSEAEKLFAEMFSDVENDELMTGPDVSTFRAMINGYVKAGRVDDAMKMLEKMKISSVRKLAIHRAT
ncbi:unnamed protein product [Arabis nemorensis]|uniref:Pentacotripeptide-repeat region of PRORP domain-containing protein n=1 Tax=Arabis nemorensis TaxID=586526 RepID=A0A565BYQ3_9BRAS|nr:unnamed protein product [Arabis nemorensis]